MTRSALKTLSEQADVDLFFGTPPACTAFDMDQVQYPNGRFLLAVRIVVAAVLGRYAVLRTKCHDHEYLSIPVDTLIH